MNSLFAAFVRGAHYLGRVDIEARAVAIAAKSHFVVFLFCCRDLPGEVASERGFNFYNSFFAICWCDYFARV